MNPTHESKTDQLRMNAAILAEQKRIRVALQQLVEAVESIAESVDPERAPTIDEMFEGIWT